YIYPPENKSIAEKIEHNGALISEFLPGTSPDPGLFPRRNRIISGLCSGVLVVQGGFKSGALITAKLALEQGRDVFAIPGNVDDKESQGPHQLIRAGGILVNSSQEIIAELGFTEGSDKFPEIKREKMPQLNPTELEVAQRLSHDPIHIDQLVQDLNKPVSSILADLLNLEMKGWVKQLPGKLFIRNR
ncbi:DNA-protecting protein DprA, partial [bacterium]|nr:DNA-protecting protein DprA [bacterium]